MIKIFLLLSMVVMLMSVKCSENNPGPPTGYVRQMTELLKPSDTGYVWLDMEEGVSNFRIEKQERQTVYAAFDAEPGQVLNAKITSSDPSANVRINQLFFPDKAADGPFGRELSYKLMRGGTYVISLGENMMAGDSWGGVVELQLSLSE